ncbi:MAG: glycosyltransferase [Bacteroidales bacterium]|nr:glycosyltransferase [Bacteroidales bacterium]
MKQNKNLILLCDNYPLSAGEFFLDDEMKVLHTGFIKIFVLVPEQVNIKLNRYVPQNVELVTYRNHLSIFSKIFIILNLFNPLLYCELKIAITKLKVRLSLTLLKILLMDIHKSNIIKKQINGLICKERLDIENLVLYAYWHDYKALALARLKRKLKTCKTVARAHNSDLFVDRQPLNYLPYKEFITKYLDKTVSISKKGKDYFKSYYNISSSSKIIVSRLGKFNDRIPQLNKSVDSYVICSCSHFNDMKRVHLIVNILIELKDLNIKWIHFGWGPTENYVRNYIKNNYPDLDFGFMGKVSNEIILDYYANNFIDIFINVSELEGIPVSIMEALSAGIPVIATDVGGTREAVPAEVGFLLKKDFDVKYAANLIRQYLNLTKQEQETYRKNAFSFWHENFNAEKNYSAFAQLLQNL